MAITIEYGKRRKEEAAIEAERRRRGILKCLDRRRHETMANLASEFGVSVRTIRRDIQILSLSYPIVTMRGAQGGVSIMEGCYYDRGSYLSESEQATVESLCLVLEGKRLADLRSILRKFSKPS